MSKFQLILLVVFGVAIIGGVMAFALGSKNKQEAVATKVTMWGVLPKSAVNEFLKGAKETYDKSINVVYTEKSATSFDRELVEALALGAGPDMVLVSHDFLKANLAKLYPLSFDSLSERTFRDSFVESAELLLSPKGILMLPMAVDPLVMYWNRDLFSSALLTAPPTTWDEFPSLSKSLTKRDSAGNITQSALSMGEVVNISNAKDILSALIMQSGSSIVDYDYKSGATSVSLEDKNKVTGLVSAEESLRFFTEFSNPAKDWYSWNRSLTSSFNMFIAGRLAVYFGFASELSDIREKNPNLNFDVAIMPQTKNAPIPKTFGRLYGVSVLKSSKNVSASFSAANLLTGVTLAPKWSETLLMAPARRALLSSSPKDAFTVVMYKSAIMSRAWLDPNPSATYAIFKEMVESVTSGSARISVAVKNAGLDMSKLLK